MIVVGTHHKTGTVLMTKIFEEVAKYKEWHFYKSTEFDPEVKTDIYFVRKSNIDLSKLPLGCKGVHLIRNPYEVVVSGYRYHLITREKWCRITKRERLGGKTYQEYLNALSLDEGVTFEMIHAAYNTICGMYHWDYADERFLNFRLEEFLETFDRALEKMFRFLSFNESDVMALLQQCRKFKKSVAVDKRGHITNKSNAVYTYRKYFKPHHYRLFNLLFPRDVIQKLGYAKERGLVKGGIVERMKGK